MASPRRPYRTSAIAFADSSPVRRSRRPGQLEPVGEGGLELRFEAFRSSAQVRFVPSELGFRELHCCNVLMASTRFLPVR